MDRKILRILGVRITSPRIDPARSLEKYLAGRPTARRVALIASTFTMLGAGLMLVARPLFSPHLYDGTIVMGSVILGIGGLVVFSVSLKAYETVDWLELRDLRQQSEKLQDKLGAGTADVLNIVQLSLIQLSEYYTINKSQARKSFNFSVFAVAVGLVTIVSGVWLVYSRRLGTGIATVSAASGLLLQFFGAANFYIYNKSLEQMNYFYDRLMQMQDAMISIKVSDQIQDGERKDKTKEHIVSELLRARQQHPLAKESKSTRKKVAPEKKAAAEA
jgi:hypothetical protein